MNRSFCSDFITICVYRLTDVVGSLPRYTHQVIWITKKFVFSTYATISFLVKSKKKLYVVWSFIDRASQYIYLSI